MIQIATAIIPAGQSLSSSVAIPGVITGFGVPSNWTAAPLTFQTSAGGPYANIWRDGNEYAASGVPGIFSQENKNYWGGVGTLKIRSGTADFPVTQAAAVLLTISYDDGK